MKNGKAYWRYQVINRGAESEPNFGIHEMDFNLPRKGDKCWTEEAMSIDNYDNLDELISDLEKMLDDAKKYHPLLESALEKDYCKF